MNALAALPKRTIEVKIPSKLRFLVGMHRYKVLYGGRGGMKTESIARALLFLGCNQPLRILCAREVQNSIRESVHETLKTLIAELGLEDFYNITENKITGINGTEFIYTGLASHTVTSIKSYAYIDIVWIEEAENVSRRSWQVLIPTLRQPNSEFWISFNPNLATDETYKRFVVSPPEGAIVVKTTMDDNPWAPKVLLDAREADRQSVTRGTMLQEEFDNIWLGLPRTTVNGAIYPREIAKMVEERRYRPVPYDPMLPVHTIWDLGWNDQMTIIMVQKPHPSTINVINYIEDSFRRYDEYVNDLNALGYNWGRDWLPHDGASKNPQTGMSAKQALRKLGRRNVKVVDRKTMGDPDDGIRQARMLFPRVYIDNADRNRPTGYLGAARLFACLSNYKRHIPKNTEEPATPVHDEHSHGADAYRLLAIVADRIRNDNEGPATARLPGFHNPDPGMGLLR